MKHFTRNVLIGGGIGCGCLVGGSYFFYANYNNKKNTQNAVPKLSGEEYNKLQDASLLKEALHPSHAPWKKSDKPRDNDFDMRFYRLLGCPYCAKVESVLKYYKLPYEERIINPLNGAGLPDPRYDLAPQIELHSPPEKEPVKSVFLVDSSYIIEKLAQPLGYQKDIEQSKDTTTVISSTRQWITSHFHSASFVLTNSTLRNAYYSYDIVTPTQYQGSLFYKLVGCAALFSIANLKLKGKVQNDGNELMKEYFQAHQKEAYPSDALQWLTEELNVFTNQIKKKNKDGAIFHGGATPDIADIEMFGVTRVIDRHPVLGKAARQGDFGAWQEAMQKFYD